MESFQNSNLYSQLYIHIPYCRSKCIYCDFFSGSVKNADWQKFLSAILVELKERVGELSSPLHTLYIGGGTPSLIPSDYFFDFISKIRDITHAKHDFLEFTIEVNPEDVSLENCLRWKESGVNRVSIGVQSFNDRELKQIKRNHSAEMACHALDLLNSYFDNISIDLMFGLPSQSIDSLAMSIDKAISFNPKHISAYSLMLEQHTPLTVLHSQGKITLPDDEEYVKMWNLLSDTLAVNQYSQYEISNYAKKGYESRHNQGYWNGNPYLGLGPGAHSYDGTNIRRWNPVKLKEYLSRFSANNRCSKIFYEEEQLSDEELLEETILTGMRKRDGVNLNYISNRFGSNALGRLISNASPLEKANLVSISNNHISLTRKGIMTSDDIILSLAM